jgi:hypothetical protein
VRLDGQDVRPEALEERRKRLSKLLSRSNKAMRAPMIGLDFVPERSIPVCIAGAAKAARSRTSLAI